MHVHVRRLRRDRTVARRATVAVFLGRGAVSWLFRVAAITLLPAARLPSTVRRLLDHAVPAALAAMVGTGIAGGAALSDLASRRPVLRGSVATAALAWRGRGIVLPVMAGLTTTCLTDP